MKGTKKKLVKDHEAALQAGVRAYRDQIEKVTLAYHKLIELAAHPHGGSGHPSPQPWLAADRLDQEALYAIQEKFAEILGELGHVLGPFQEQLLIQKLPWAFKPAEVKTDGA